MNLIAHARVTLRLAALAVWTIGWFCARLFVLALRPVMPRAERVLRQRVLQMWGHGALRIVGAKTTVIGTPPRPPYFLVANHLSYVDGVLLAAVLGGVFVGMTEIRGWPLIGTLAQFVDTIFIDRKRNRDALRAIDAIENAVHRGHGVVVFVESTTSTGERVLPFKPALLQPAIDLAMPVHYATIQYFTREPAPPPAGSICWVDDTPFHVHALRLLQLRQFSARVTFGESAVLGTDRKVLARQLEVLVGNAIEPDSNMSPAAIARS